MQLPQRRHHQSGEMPASSVEHAHMYPLVADCVSVHRILSPEGRKSLGQVISPGTRPGLARLLASHKEGPPKPRSFTRKSAPSRANTIGVKRNNLKRNSCRERKNASSVLQELKNNHVKIESLPFSIPISLRGPAHQWLCAQRLYSPMSASNPTV
jgi:hypothetical protein